MDFLPKITRIVQKPSFIENVNFDINSLDELEDVVADIIGGSCLSMVINEEIIWNEYDKRLSYSEIFYQNSIRDSLSQNPKTLIYEILKKKQDTRVYFYMYKDDPLLIILFINDFEYNLKFMK